MTCIYIAVVKLSKTSSLFPIKALWFPSHNHFLLIYYAVSVQTSNTSCVKICIDILWIEIFGILRTFKYIYTCATILNASNNKIYISHSIVNVGIKGSPSFIITFIIQWHFTVCTYILLFALWINYMSLHVTYILLVFCCQYPLRDVLLSILSSTKYSI